MLATRGAGHPPHEADLTRRAADAFTPLMALPPFVAALDAYPRLRPDSNVRAWLVTIAHRKAIDHLRRAGRRAVPVGDPPELAVLDPVSQVDDDELRAAVRRLPFKQRAAVTYRYLADPTFAQELEALQDETNQRAAARLQSNAAQAIKCGDASIMA